MKTVAVYPGSFDPVTLGHLSVLKRAAGLFSEVVVMVTHNPSKTPVFGSQERVSLLEATIAQAGIDNVRVSLLDEGLLVSQMNQLGAKAIIKGLRTSGDFEYELPMAQVNRDLAGVETVFLAAEPEYGYVSSSLVREVAALGGDISSYVPGVVAKALSERFAK